MRPLNDMPEAAHSAIRFVLTDIDDTLTSEGRLRAEAYLAMEQLQEQGMKVIPITGRPAGWCDHIARMWPVDAVVGENGAFFYRYDNTARKMLRRYCKDEAERAADKLKLAELQKTILQAVPGAAISADQAFREADLAVDFCEDVPPLPKEDISAIKALFEAAGAHAKISSIHVNGWFGDYDKLSMTEILFREEFGLELADIRDQVVFSGDSPNDAPMFGYFPHSVGVANVLDFRDELEAAPTWVTQGRGGSGFAELARFLLGK